MKDSDVLNWIKKFYAVFSGYSKREMDVSGILARLDRIDAESYEHGEPLRGLFRAGYCWHFSHMLQNTFGRGTVCLAAPFSHFVWKDEDGQVYDCEGVYYGEAFYFIPETYIPEAYVQGFKHIPGDDGTYVSKDDLIQLMKDFCKRTGAEYNQRVEHYLED
jgi:hypothetical protein